LLCLSTWFYFMNNEPHRTNSQGNGNLKSHYTIIVIGHTTDF